MTGKDERKGKDDKQSDYVQYALGSADIAMTLMGDSTPKEFRNAIDAADIDRAMEFAEQHRKEYFNLDIWVINCKAKQRNG